MSDLDPLRKLKNRPKYTAFLLILAFLFVGYSPVPSNVTSEGEKEEVEKTVKTAENFPTLLHVSGDRADCGSDIHEETQEIELRKFKGPSAYQEYSNLVRKLNKRIRKAKEKTKKYAESAEAAFKSGDYELSKTFSKMEIDAYPVVSMNGIKFRILSEIEIKREEEVDFFHSMDPFEDIRHLSTSEGYFELYKVVPKQHLCSIKKNGLDSKFGGIGGASETIPGFQSLAWRYDRGRMFFNYGRFTTDYDDAFSAKGVELSKLQIHIPVDETKALNLTTTKKFDEWFIAGTTIPPDYIFLQDAKKKYLPLSKTECH
jgi:hypothetical protein